MSQTHSSPPKRLVIHKNKCTRGQDNTENLRGSRFNTAAGIARQFSAEQGKDLSWHTVSRRWTESPLSLHQQKEIKRPLANWSKAHFSDESKVNLFGSDGNIMFIVKLGKDWTLRCVKQSVKGGGGSVMVWGMFCAAGVGPLYNDTRQSECRCLSEPPAATCSSFPAFISQSASTFNAGQCPLSHSKTCKAVPWSWKHWNNPDLNLIKHLWKILGDTVMAKKPTTH